MTLRTNRWFVRLIAAGLACWYFVVAGTARGDIFFGPIRNPDDSEGFFGTDFFKWGNYSINDGVRVDDDNDVVRISSGFHSPISHGAGMSIHISNGENGNNGEDLSDPDQFNFIPADSGFARIGNDHNRLNNGNAIRFSVWMRQDPDDLIQVAPNVEPVVKLEFWTEALGNANNADPFVNPNPTRADRIYDTQLQGDSASFVDLDGDGSVNNQIGGGGDSFSLNAQWTLVSTTYTVDDNGWGYDYPTGFVSKTVFDVEEVRATMYWSEFEDNDLTDGGSVLIDQPMIEVYRTAADMPGAIPNPHPDNPLNDPDFNDDGQLDCADVDQLVMEISVGSDNPSFDLTGEGEVNQADLDLWLTAAGAANLDSRNAYLKGDANLDGVVDVSDFNRWNTNKFTNVPAWCSGDFNADGVIDVSDFNVWNANKFQSADVSVVPEPSSTVGFISGLIFALLQLRRRRLCV